MKNALKSTRNLLITLFLIFVSPLGLVHTPYLQQVGIAYVTKILRENGVDVSIEGLDIAFPLSLSVEKIKLQIDGQGSYIVQNIFVSPDLSSILFLSPQIKHLNIDSLVVNFDRNEIEKKTEDKNIIGEVQSYLLLLKERYIQNASIKNIYIDGVNEKFSSIIETNKSGSNFSLYKNETDLLANVNFIDTGLQKGEVLFHFLNFDKISSFKDLFLFFKERNLSLNEMKGKIDFFAAKRFVDFKLSNKLIFSNGDIDISCELNKASNFKLHAVNSVTVDIPLFGNFKQIQFDAQKNENNNWVVSNSDIEGSDLSLNISGEIKDINQLLCGAFQNLKPDLCLSFSGRLINEYFSKPSFNIKLTSGDEKHVSFNALASVKNLKSNALKTILGKKINIYFKKDQEGSFLDIDCIKGNKLTINMDNELSQANLIIEKKVNGALLDNSTISLIKKGQEYLLEGSIKPIGKNIIKFDSTIVPKENKIAKGFISLNFKDLAPLTTPFDFATVGSILGEIKFSNFSIINKTGKMNIDLKSKYFRSPIFKTEESSFVGTVDGDLSPNLTLKVKTLAIGKNFLAEKTEASLFRKNQSNNFKLISSSHKKGYLSSNLDIKIDIDYFNQNKKYLHINEFFVNHLDQKVKIKNPFDIFIDPLLIKKGEILVNDGVIDCSNIYIPKGNSDNMKGQVNINNLPVALINWFIPKTLMIGSVNGQITLGGVEEKPDIKMKLEGRKLHWRKLHTDLNLKESFLDFDVNTHLMNEILKYDVSFRGKNIINCSLTGSLPINMESLEPLKGKYSGYVNLSLVSAIIATGDRLSGDIKFDLDLSGTLSEPFWKGYICTDNSYVELAEFGTIINEIKGKIVAEGKKWFVRGLTANDNPLRVKSKKERKRGTLSFHGSFDFKTIYNPYVDVSLKLTDYTVVNTDAIKGRVNSVLRVLGEGIYSEISGDVGIQEFSIDLDHFDSNDSIPSIDLRDPQKRRFAKDYQKENFSDKSKQVILPLNLKIQTNGKFNLFGKALQDTLWGGEITVLGPIMDPYLKGSVSVLKGMILLFGKTLLISSGKVSFSEHDPNEPWVVLDAIRKTSDIIITMKIDTKQDPLIRFESSPSKAQNDIISHLLFGKGTATMTAGESIQLAFALSELQGQGKQFSGILTDLKKNLWFDTVELRQEQDEKSSNLEKKSQQVVHLGKKLSDSIEFSFQQGSDSSSLGLEMEVGKNVTLDASFSKKPDDNSNIGKSTGAGITWSKRY